MNHYEHDEAPGQPRRDQGHPSDAYDGRTDLYDRPSSGYDGPRDGYDPTAPYDRARRYDGPAREISESRRSSS